MKSIQKENQVFFFFFGPSKYNKPIYYSYQDNEALYFLL